MDHYIHQIPGQLPLKSPIFKNSAIHGEGFHKEISQ
jgi:hypothetical protein